MSPHIQYRLGWFMILCPLAYSVAEERIYTLTTEQLKCIYEQVYSLISEPADPIVVLLTPSQCKPSETPALPNSEKVEFPPLDPKVDWCSVKSN